MSCLHFFSYGFHEIDWIRIRRLDSHRGLLGVGRQISDLEFPHSRFNRFLEIQSRIIANSHNQRQRWYLVQDFQGSSRSFSLQVCIAATKILLISMQRLICGALRKMGFQLCLMHQPRQTSLRFPTCLARRRKVSTFLTHVLLMYVRSSRTMPRSPMSKTTVGTKRFHGSSLAERRHRKIS